MPPTHGSGRNVPGSIPKAHKNFNVLNLIDIEATFDAIDDSVHKRLADPLTTPVDEVLGVLPANTDEMIAVVKSVADG